MNKFNYMLLGGTLLLATACSQDNLQNPTPEGNRTTFTVKLSADAVTRATMGDASTANMLTVLVYDGANNSLLLNSGDNTPEISISDFNPENNTCTVELELIKDKTYTIAFFAQSENSTNVYVINPYNGTMTVNYGSMTGALTNSDDYDCFYGNWTGKGGDTTVSTNVTLTRPVAQLCWGTSNNIESNTVTTLFGENAQYMQSNLTAENVPSVLNLLAAEGEEATSVPVKITLNNFARPMGVDFPLANNEDENGNPIYWYVATQFVLAPTNSGVTNLTLDINNGYNNENATSDNIAVPLNNAPFQANYQTVIYGNLLTSNTSLTVTKNEVWNDYYYSNYPTAPAQNTAGQFVMRSQGNFTWLAQEVANGNTQAGNTFVLEDDVYFVEPHTPIGAPGKYTFQGTFDGQKHAIHNLTINTASGTTTAYKGLFGYVSGGATIKNLTLNNVTITGTSGDRVGIVAGQTANATLDYITVTGNVEINLPEANRVGGMVGYLGNNTTLTNLTMAATSGSINASTYVGGIVGGMDPCTPTFDNLKSNIAMKAVAYIGGIIGIANPVTTNPLVFNECVNSGALSINVSATNNNRYFIGGIAGAWVNNEGVTVTFTECKNDGDLIWPAWASSIEGFPYYELNDIVGVGTVQQPYGTLNINGDEGVEADHWFFPSTN